MKGDGKINLSQSPFTNSCIDNNSYIKNNLEIDDKKVSIQIFEENNKE